MNSQLHDYLKQLLADAGQSDLPENLQETMIQDLSSRLEQRLILAAVEKLTEAQQEELTKLGENQENSAQVMEFLKKNIPDYDQVFADALESFREVYLGAQQ